MHHENSPHDLSPGPISAPHLFAPSLKINRRLRVRIGIQAHGRSTFFDFLCHKILKYRHFNRFIRQLLGEMGRQHQHAIRITHDHITRKNGRITTADRDINIDRMMVREICRGGRALMIGANP